MIEEMERECWNLDITMADFILPRLLYYKNWMHRYSVPADFYDRDSETIFEDEWIEVVDEMIFAMAYATHDYTWYELECDFEWDNESDEFGCILRPTDPAMLEKYNKAKAKHQARYENGMRLFAKYFSSLWD